MVKETSAYPKGWCDIPVEKLIAADWNYKDEDEAKSEKLLGNLKRNGQVESIIVRRLDTGFYEVVNGNHRLALFQKAGINVAHVYNVDKVSDASARRLAIETNETRFETNAVRLAELMKEISEEFNEEDLVSTMPFSEAELENMNRMLEFDWNSSDSSGGDGSTGSSADPNDLGLQKKIVLEVSSEKYEEVKACIQSIVDSYKGHAKLK